MTRTTARQAMIDAAERLVAERGMPAMTLKDVQIAADQSNKSAAKYHFGSRDGLIEAVVEARMSPVDRRRQEILDEWARQGLSPTPRQVVEALVQPLAAQTLGRPGSRYARFLVQATFDPALADIIQKHMSAKSFRHMHDLLVNLAEVPREVAAWRASDAITLAMVTLAMREGQDRTPRQTAAIVSDLVDICVAVLTAPMSPETTEITGDPATFDS
ncbi:TetR/AcrR family transcriptional regulator [Rhodococcus sp. AG1013]|uniref:TetR/AcrR family transcriptional regulator n=1 Tax=unclassified Rhodococcus (in: high G+C Gram-positive bacteria) TaxID=192944 RepID=UPI002852E255|nr:helix-turn-helix domain-containing protein [Rhodococcus sp. AG1013]